MKGTRNPFTPSRGALILLFTLSACGATVGDPCTTPSDCGGQTCINADFAPGGYCSRQCVLNDDRSCPGGSICVKDGQAKDVHACFRTCLTQNDCRSGYQCRGFRDSTQNVCVGAG